MRTLMTTLVSSILFAAPAAADVGDGIYGHHHMFGGDGWGYMMMGPVMMLLFLAAAVLLTLGVVRWLWPGAKGGEDQATTLLRERFAKGEIDQAEFDERLQILQGRR